MKRKRAASPCGVGAPDADQPFFGTASSELAGEDNSRPTGLNYKSDFIVQWKCKYGPNATIQQMRDTGLVRWQVGTILSPGLLRMVLSDHHERDGLRQRLRYGFSFAFVRPRAAGSEI